MRVVITGYGEMFRSVTEAVLSGKHEVVAVLPFENVKNCGFTRLFAHAFSPSEDYKFIKKRNLKIINSRGMNRNSFRSFIKSNDINAVIVCSWGEKISQETLDVLPFGMINVHPSFLPKYRGPNPYLRVIMNGEKETGVTFHLIDNNYDTGDILDRIKVPIENDDTGKTLKLRCCDYASREVNRLLDNFPDMLKSAIKQNDDEATCQKQPDISEIIIQFDKETSLQISARIRAFNPWSKCYIPYGNEFFSFENFEITGVQTDEPPGTITEKSPKHLSIVCKDGAVMNFYLPRLYSPFGNILTGFYIKNFVKNKSKAV